MLVDPKLHVVKSLILRKKDWYHCLCQKLMDPKLRVVKSLILRKKDWYHCLCQKLMDPNLHLVKTICQKLMDPKLHVVKSLILRKKGWYHCLCQKLMKLKASSSQKLSSNITPFGTRGLPEVDVPSSNLWFKCLGYLKMNHCMSLKFLSKLPPYLRYLNAHGCTSLERVWFPYQDRDLYEPHSFDAEDEFLMIFSNCFSLKEVSIYNIEVNAMIKDRSLAKKCACGPKRVICCIPGNKISANRFKNRSVDSSLILKIVPNGCSGRRFLVFAICLVADLMHCQISGDLQFICEYQLTVAGGDDEKFRSEWCYKLDYMSKPEYMGDHKLILFSGDMIKEDKDYEEASFQFYIKNRYYSGEDNDIKVKKCGAHLSYVDGMGNVLQQRKRRMRKRPRWVPKFN
ncbi:hypothetical protein V6N13_092149 [Hibiscus sabdariffa]